MNTSLHNDDGVEGTDNSENTDDLDFVEIDESTQAVVKKLQDKLKKCREERQEFLDGWQRSKADFLNTKNRAENDRHQEIQRIKAGFLRSLLPLCDSFDMALSHSEDLDNASESLRRGMDQIHSQLKSIFDEYDVVEIDAMGAQFDPELHEALSSTTIADGEGDNTVIEVVQKGYTIGGTLLRPAKVIIGTNM